MAMISVVEPRERIQVERNFDILKFTRTQTRKKITRDGSMFQRVFSISKIQLVVYHQCCVLIGGATSGLYVIAH